MVKKSLGEVEDLSQTLHPVGVDLSGADEKISTTGERMVPDDVAGGRLHDGYFKSREGFPAKGHSHELS